MLPKIVCASIRQIAWVGLANKDQISTIMQIDTPRRFFFITNVIKKQTNVYLNAVLK